MKSLINTKYREINLEDMLSQLGEDKTKNILSSFVCPQNVDVQNFIREKAIIFSNCGYAKTYLVYWQAEESDFGEEKKELVGYYAIGTKLFKISRDNSIGRISSKKWRNICQVANTRSSSSECALSAHLVGQLSKNYDNGNELLISGDDLLAMALQKILEVQKLIGGKIVYVECENEEKLISFYKRNGFELVGERFLDGDETGIKGQSLMQLYKYLD